MAKRQKTVPPTTVVTEPMLRDAKRAEETAARLERGEIPGQ